MTAPSETGIPRANSQGAQAGAPLRLNAAPYPHAIDTTPAKSATKAQSLVGSVRDVVTSEDMPSAMARLHQINASSAKVASQCSPI
jgi:hypothetical protein